MRAGASDAPTVERLGDTSAGADFSPCHRYRYWLWRRWGYDALEVCNLFTWRATDPRELLAATEPVGPANDGILFETARTTGLIVLARGNLGRHRGRSEAVIDRLRDLGPPLHCLRVNRASGMPAHPLYQRADLTPQPWDRPISSGFR